MVANAKTIQETIAVLEWKLTKEIQNQLLSVYSVTGT
jgi:hypothetical protein